MRSFATLTELETCGFWQTASNKCGLQRVLEVVISSGSRLSSLSLSDAEPADNAAFAHTLARMTFLQSLTLRYFRNMRLDLSPLAAHTLHVSGMFAVDVTKSLQAFADHGTPITDLSLIDIEKTHAESLARLPLKRLTLLTNYWCPFEALPSSLTSLCIDALSEDADAGWAERLVAPPLQELRIGVGLVPAELVAQCLVLLVDRLCCLSLDRVSSRKLTGLATALASLPLLRSLELTESALRSVRARARASPLPLSQLPCMRVVNRHAPSLYLCHAGCLRGLGCALAHVADSGHPGG
jgi:hypothetical protein